MQHQQQFHTPVQSPIVKLQPGGGDTALTALANSGTVIRRPASSEGGRSHRSGMSATNKPSPKYNNSSHSPDTVDLLGQRPHTARPGKPASVASSSSAASVTSSVAAQKRKEAVAAVIAANNGGMNMSHSNHNLNNNNNSSSATRHYNPHRIVVAHAGHIVATSPHHGLIQTPLDVKDVEMSVRLMQCLDNFKRPADGPHDHVEKRFRTGLRTTTQATRDEHWARRMESVKALRAKQQAEIHCRTQMHQLFKHYAFEQRMVSRSNTPSVAAAAAAAISGGVSSVGGGAVGSGGAAATTVGGDGASTATTAGTIRTLFPTTANSLTRNQMDEYFAVPSFVRPLLSTFRRPTAADGYHNQHGDSNSMLLMGARSVSISTTGGGGGGHPLPHMREYAVDSRTSSAYDPAAFAEHFAEEIDASHRSNQNEQSEESFRRARAALASQNVAVARGNVRHFK